MLNAYLNNNLGDDLFIIHLANSLPEIDLVIECSEWQARAFRDIDNIIVLHPFDTKFSILKRIGKKVNNIRKRKINDYIYIGGSIFIEYENWKNILNWWDWISRNYDLSVIGANFGPFQSNEYLAAFKRISAQFKLFTLRDRYSYDLFRDNKNIYYSPDILFSYPLPHMPVNKNQIVINSMDLLDRSKDDPCLSKYYDNYITSLINISVNLIENKKYITFISFCSNQNDHRSAIKIGRGIGVNSQVNYLGYSGVNVDEIITKIVTSELVIATRFHAIVLAIAADIPVLPIIYSNKTLNMLHDIGYQGPIWDFRKGDRLDPKTLEQIRKPSTYINIDDVKNKSRIHIDLLRERVLGDLNGTN